MSKIDVEGKKRTICQKLGRYFSCTKLVKKSFPPLNGKDATFAE